MERTGEVVDLLNELRNRLFSLFYILDELISFSHNDIRDGQQTCNTRRDSKCFGHRSL
jgi:hypothetical protein